MTNENPTMNAYYPELQFLDLTDASTAEQQLIQNVLYGNGNCSSVEFPWNFGQWHWRNCEQAEETILVAEPEPELQEQLLPVDTISHHCLPYPGIPLVAAQEHPPCIPCLPAPVISMHHVMPVLSNSPPMHTRETIMPPQSEQHQVYVLQQQPLPPPPNLVMTGDSGICNGGEGAKCDGQEKNSGRRNKKKRPDGYFDRPSPYLQPEMASMSDQCTTVAPMMVTTQLPATQMPVPVDIATIASVVQTQTMTQPNSFPPISHMTMAPVSNMPSSYTIYNPAPPVMFQPTYPRSLGMVFSTFPPNYVSHTTPMPRQLISSIQASVTIGEAQLMQTHSDQFHNGLGLVNSQLPHVQALDIEFTSPCMLAVQSDLLVDASVENVSSRSSCIEGASKTEIPIQKINDDSREGFAESNNDSYAISPVNRDEPSNLVSEMENKLTMTSAPAGDSTVSERAEESEKAEPAKQPSNARPSASPVEVLEIRPKRKHAIKDVNNEAEKAEATSKTLNDTPGAKSWASLFRPELPSAEAHNYSLPDSGKLKFDAGSADEGSLQATNCDLGDGSINDHSESQLGDLLSMIEPDYHSVLIQPRGLTNKGNWCYINATLQALLACPPFYNLMKQLPVVAGLDRNPSSIPLIDAMVEFVNEFKPLPQPLPQQLKGGKGSQKKEAFSPEDAFEPKYVYKMLSRIKTETSFNQGRQEDAEEFLCCLLNGLHDEMISLINSSKTSSVKNGDAKVNGELNHVQDNNAPDTGGEPDDWQVMGRKNKSCITRAAPSSKSPISEIFGGQMRSILQKAGSQSANVQPFFTLQLDIQPSNVKSVKTALEYLVIKENIQGYTCDKTKQEVEASRRITFDETPRVLILHLKRFVYEMKDGNVGVCKKLNKHVDFTIDLELNKDLFSATRLTKEQRSYNLFAVVYHRGEEAVKGHYIADVYHTGCGCWIRADDNNIQKLPNHFVKQTSNLMPYILYYRRLDTISEGSSKSQ